MDKKYIEEKFRLDGLETPESLSEEAMLARLQAAEEGPATETSGRTGEAGATQTPAPAVREDRAVRRPTFFRRHRGLAAIAACLVLAVATVPLWKEAGENFWYGADVMTGEGQDSLVAFQNYEDIRAELKKIDQNQIAFRKETLYANVLEGDMAATEEAPSDDAVSAGNGAAPGLAAKGAAGSSGNTEANSYSETYKQVEGVDEADIIKTDGKYIYHITMDGEIQVSKPDGKKAEAITTIKPGKHAGFTDLYLREDRLIAIGSMYDGSMTKGGIVPENDRASVTVYDMTDPAHPEKRKQFQQSGNVVSSRMADGYVYLVTDCYAGEKEDFVPRTTSDGKEKKLAAQDIYCMPSPSGRSYAVLSAIDIDGGTKEEAKTKAVLGASEEIYCNGEHMYIAGAEADGMVGAYWYPGYRPAYTRILKADLKDGKVKFLHSVRVRGSINDQFSMDEKDGYLRVVTTSNKDGKDENNLYVLDAKLKKAGSVKGFARDEHIESVRFLGDRGYVITYRQTDPLFVLDLSNPRKPKIDGSVKISGFSTLLVPVDEKTLLGIGYCTRSTEGGEALNGTKLALFDVSNPSKPKVKDSKEFPGMDSPAQFEHKALLVGPGSSWYAIPYTIWQDDWTGIEDAEELPDVIEEDVVDGEPEEAAPDVTIDTDSDYTTGCEGGVLTFSAGSKLSKSKKHSLSDQGMQRAVYINGYIYGLDEGDQITGMKFGGNH